MTITLSILIALAATAAIVGDYRGPKTLHYVGKPAATTLLLLLVLVRGEHSESTYQWLIALGMIASLAGDVFLMLPVQRFVAGLLSFLVAHFLYIAAFTSDTGLGGDPLYLVPFLLAAGGFLFFLLPRAGKLKIPVIVYTAALVMMAWQALLRYEHIGTDWALCAAIGAILFVISDATLSVRKFVNNFHWSQAIILSTYFAAQWLIALSV